MKDLVQYIFREVKGRRLSKADGIDFIRQFQERHSVGVPVMHPLLQRNTSDFTEQRFSSTLHGQEFFLVDHVVKGQKVLPGVAYLEMAREAVVRASGRQHDPALGVRLRNVVWARPIVVQDAPVEAHVGLYPGSDGAVEYEIYVLPEDEAGEPAMHSRGLAELVAGGAGTIDVAALRQSCSREHLTAAGFYEIYRGKGLALGPSLRAVQEVFIGEDVVLARLKMPEAADREGYLLHPSMMDATVTASVGLRVRGGEVEGPLALPFALQELEVLGGDGCTGEMWAVARFSPGSNGSDRVQKYDLDLCDDAGHVRARFKGFSTRLLDTAARDGASGTSVAPETLLLCPEWRSASALAGEANRYADHLVLLGADTVDAAALAERLSVRCEQLPDDYSAQAEAVLAKLQMLLEARPAAPVLLQLVVPEVGPHRVAAGLVGLLKSARLENSKLIGQVIAVGCDDGLDQVAAKLKENSRSPQDVQIRYAEGERQVLGWSELAAEQPSLPWQDGAVYLITGGLGGLGQIFAKEIAGHAKGATLVLIGRRELDEVGRQQVRELEALGATVEYRALDLADREAVRRLVQQIQEDHAALNGIVHSAGVIRDSLLVKKTKAELAKVLAPKVAGLRNLDEASRDIQLDWFICFSSMAAVRGNPGQGDYAAANAFMDTYAAYRNSLVAAGQRHGRTLSVNWPLWQDGGMRVDPATERAMEQATGMMPMRSASGIQALYRALASGLDQVAVVEGRAARMRQALLSEAAAAPAAVAQAGSAARATRTEAVPDALPTVADGDVLLDKVQRMLMSSVAKATKLKVGEIDRDVELTRYGFDSLMLSDFVNKLNRDYQLDLAPTVFFEYPTLNSLARHLSKEHQATMATALSVQPRQAAAAEAGLPAAPAEAVPTSSPAIAADVLLDKVKRLLTQAAAKLLKLKATEINGDAELSSYGFDSLMLSEFVNRLNQDYGFGLAPTVFFEYSTLNNFARHLSEQHHALLVKHFALQSGPAAAVPSATDAARSIVATTTARGAGRRPRFAASTAAAAALPCAVRKNDDPVVIVGISGCFPMADDIDTFWRNLAEGRTCISEVPPDRWDWCDYYGDPTKEPNKTNIKLGGFINGVGHFDPLFFGISPKEAELMDPQQRLLMLHVWNCIEDAGYAPASLAGSNTAIFAGTASTGYSRLVFRAQMTIEGYMNTGAAPSVGPNRMSYFLDLHGPSEPVETACSSALVAIRRGVQAIESGECELAIAGGVNTIVNPDAHISFSKAGMLCEDGRCKTFSDQANGYVRGEGVAMLLLKRLSAAERDGDHIYGIVRGTAENHGGRANSLTAPNPKAQAELIKSAFHEAGIDPRTVGYMEAHGTGTPLGDPVEVNGLKMAFRDLYATTGAPEVKDVHCGIGSVKTNIGHLEMAAGVAGVIKVLLQMRHKTLVPSLHCETVNPYIDLKGSPFYIVREAREWAPMHDADGNPLPRRAGVSSFGFGGVNAHVVLEEYLPTAPPQPSPAVDDEHPALIVLSARNAERLQDRVAQLRDAVRRGVVTPANLADAAYTLQVGREAMEARLALAATSLDDLVAKLDAVLAGETASDDVYRGEAKRHKQELALFVADEDATRMLEAWLARGKYGKLLELWAKGLNFDWTRLYADRKPCRLRLPAYPFAKERYWVPDVGAKPLLGAAALPAGATLSALHPLLHRNTSNLEEQRFSTRFSGEECFLADHLVQGRKMLPGVAHLEMARAAVARALALDEGEAVEAGLCFRNIVFARPILVGDDGLEVHVGVRPDASGGFAYELYGQAPGGGERLVYSQGIAALAPAAEARVDLAAVRAACAPDPLPPAVFYGLFRDHGLILGDSLRAVQALYLGENLVLARLAMPAAVLADKTRYLLHPSMLDAAVTSPAGLRLRAKEAQERLALPFALEALEIAGDCQESMWVVARRSAGSMATDRVQKFDLDLCDESGRVCVRFRGLSVRTFDSAAGAGGGREAVETLLLQPEWRAVPAATGAAPAYDELLVLLCGSPVDAGALSARLAIRCEQLPDDYAVQAEVVRARLQALLQKKPTAAVLVQLVVPRFGPQQAAAGLAGLLRSAQLEHRKLVGQVIAVDRQDDVSGLATKLEENRCHPQDVRIRYVEGERQVLGWRDLSPGQPVMPWKAGGTYLVTGGLGGLGGIFAKEIATQARGATLVLTGRRELDEAGRQVVRELEALGAKVEYRAVDVADREAVRHLVLEIQEDHQALNGIVHSAGIVRDSLLLKKTPDAMREVLAPKVAGLVNLDEASRDVELDCFVCFSSLAAVSGNVGQTDYAAGNAFMDAYAAYRNSLAANGQRHGRMLSVNWPLWQDGGMRVDAATERAMQQSTGMVALRTASGIDALYRAFGSKLDQVAVAEGDATRLRQLLAGQPVVEAAVATPQPAAAAAEASADGGSSPVDRIARLLVRVVAAQAKLKPEVIKGDTELNEYGFDSLMLTELGNALNHEYQLDLTPTVFFEYPTLNTLAQHLSTRYAAKFAALLGAAEPARPATTGAVPAPAVRPQAVHDRFAALRRLPLPAATAAEPIAIISLAGRFPQADDLDALWETVRNGRDGVTEVPADRWDMARYYDPQPGRLGKSSSKWGGFIDGIDRFDALFFQISPRDALSLDPQVRLFLQTVWSLVESAGYTRDSLRQSHQGRVGVYVGATAQPTRPANDGEKVTAELSASSAIANRVSYFFNFEGPSLAVDTMCSSAMMALHLACRDLQQGECELAVAGGVCLLMSPQKYVGMSQARLFGSHPESRSFTEGDGYQPAETVGAVLLKPLSNAVADGDPILAVIKGTATHNSGRSNGYAAPNPKVQAKVIAESLRRAGVGPDSIGWIEAAAAGIALGDASEMAALGSVFSGLAPAGRKVPVGTVKSNFGHSEHGSGIAQLAKVVLQLKHRQLAPLLSVGMPNRQLRLEETPFELQRELAAWEPLLGPDGRPQPRRALVNSFAAGGSCVSAVIEEYLPAVAPQVGEALPPAAQLFVFSARNGERLRAVVEQTLQRLESDHDVVLRDLAYTLQVGREAMDTRLAQVATTHAELRQGLRAWLDGQEAAGGAAFRSGDEQAVPLSADESQVEALVAAGDLAGLAQFWVRGGAVPWAQLHSGQPVRRIAWATYPFAPTVYPIDYEQAQAVRGAAVAGSVAGLGGAAGNSARAVVSAATAASADSAVAHSVAGALGMPVCELPLHKPLQTLGYNSLAAMELKYRLEAALQRPIELALISDAGRTVAELARQLAGAASPRSAGAAPVAVSPALPVLVPQPDARYQPFPLTDMQEAFLLGRQPAIGGDRVGAHIYLEIDVRGTLDLIRLNRAWNRLIVRHEMLRAVIVDGGQQILQEVPPYRCRTIDFRVMDEVERRFKAGLLRETMEHRMYSGDEWPQFDIRVAIHGDGRYRIHFSIDELIVDGLSVDTLLRQWDRLYADPDLALPALELTFRDYVLAMKAFERSDRYQQDLTYWRQRLEKLPGGPDFPRPAMAEDDSRLHRTRLNYRLPAAAWAVLKEKAATLGVSPTALVLGVFAEVLRGWSGSPSFTLVLTYFNRPPLHPQIRELIGPAISSLLFVVEPPSGDDFEAIVKAHHQRLWQDLDHSSVSGIQALRRLRSQAGRRSTPLTLPVVFTSMLGSDVTAAGLRHLGDVSYVVNQTPQVYLDHQLRDSAAGLDCSWDVVEGYFAPGFVQAMFDAYGKALEGLAGGRLPWTVASFVRPATAIDALDPTTAQLAGFLAEARREDPLAPFPLTDQQQAYAFGRDTRLEGGGSSCQFYQELQVERLDVARLEQALATLIARHPMLRTVADVNGSQSVLAQAPRYAVAVADLRQHEAEARQTALAATRHALLDRVVPLGEWPYFTVKVSLLEGETACVHLCFDLMLVDSTSIGRLLIELIQLYEQPQSVLPEVGPSFREYQRAVERFRATPGYTERLAYWNRKFAALPGGPALPQQPAAGVTAADAHRRIDGVLAGWEGLKRQAEAHRVAPGLILLTAYLEVLYAWNGQQPLAVVVPGWERLPVHPDIEQVVGDFTTLSWVARGPEVLSFADRLAQVARQHGADLAQRPVSGLQALRRVMLRDRRQLRYPVVFTNQITPLALPSAQFKLGEALSRTPQVYLDNLSSEAGSRLHCSWDFAGGVYAPEMVKEMFGGYLRLLELLGSQPQAWSRSDFGDLIREGRSVYSADYDRLEGVV